MRDARHDGSNGPRIERIARILVLATLLVIAGHLPPAASQSAPAAGQEADGHMLKMDSGKLADWRRRWERNILVRARIRYCDTEMGEELAWFLAQFLKGFYFGYEATGDPRWVRMLVDWTDAWMARAVTEPDGYPGWPKIGAAGTPVDGLDDFYADSLLGEAMTLLPVMQMSRRILADPALKASFGTRAEAYIALSNKLFEKWDRRGAWRRTDNDGMISVVLPFGIDRRTGDWTDGYASRNAPGHGHSHPDNKANWVASWLLSMYDATGENRYRERAEGWFRLMKSRMKLEDDGTYRIWNYWEPGGPWDYLGPGVPKHWIGVHPNAGYYDSDVRAIVMAYEDHVVFDHGDIQRLVATALAHERYWTALVPYSRAVQREFEDHEDPDSWPGLWEAPWYLALQAGRLPAAP
jgi:hypothetical protein